MRSIDPQELEGEERLGVGIIYRDVRLFKWWVVIIIKIVLLLVWCAEGGK